MDQFWLISMLLLVASCVVNGKDITLTCPENYLLRNVHGKSYEHIGEGSYLVSVCCPKSHQYAEFFGREGVGCCKTMGHKCVFECRCNDGTAPAKTESPIPSPSQQKQKTHHRFNVLTKMCKRKLLMKLNLRRQHQ